MLARRTPSSSCLVNAHLIQQRKAATKLAPKWTPSSQSEHSIDPPSYATTRNPTPAKWARSQLKHTVDLSFSQPSTSTQAKQNYGNDTDTSSRIDNWTKRNTRDVEPGFPRGYQSFEKGTVASSPMNKWKKSTNTLNPSQGNPVVNLPPTSKWAKPNTTFSQNPAVGKWTKSTTTLNQNPLRSQDKAVVTHDTCGTRGVDGRYSEKAGTTAGSSALENSNKNEAAALDIEKRIHLRADEQLATEEARARRHEAKFKTRGSLRHGGEIHRQPRVSDVRAAKLTKARAVKIIKYTQDVYIPTVVSVVQLARLLGVKLESLRRKMVQAGMEDATSYDHVLNAEYASMLALEFNKNPIVDDEAAFDLFPQAINPDPSTLPVRPPIVTIMGHVDHGKTTLLDTLRSTSVAKGEAGGITQHIGAFSVPVSGNSLGAAPTITFLDTPGHAAFSAMRARGANVTDIVVLIVAADDGVMPQTKEVIELIKKDDGKVNLVVVINKMDKPGANPEAIQKELLTEGLQLETFGGHIPTVQVSGLTGKGLDELVETLSLVAEMADLRAEHKGDAYGYVLESKVSKGLGPVANVLILRGELTPTTHLISGTAHARVRQLLDSSGKVVKAAYPGMAVTISGWKELPSAGDEVLQGKEAEIKKALANRRRRLELATVVQDADAINTQRKKDREKRDEKEETENTTAGSDTIQPKSTPDGLKELRLIIKCDVSGSVEAVVGALQGIGNKEVMVKIVQSTVGDVSESDVMLAKTAEGLVVAFAVGVPRAIQTLAARNDVPIITSSIIYRLMDDVKAKVIAMLPPIIETRVTGEATVAQLFNIQLKHHEFLKIAGCRVTNGLLEKNKKVRVVRNSTVIHEAGALQTLRHLKKDMLEIRKEMECGLSIQGHDDLQVGDIIQSIQVVERPGLL